MEQGVLSVPKEKNNNKISLKPVVVLVCICLVMSGLLAVVNYVTAPIIEAAAQERLAATLRHLLPDATTFTEIKTDMPGVVAIYKDDGGSGFAIVTIGKGYKGDVTVTTAIDPSGTVLGISVDASGETANVGTRVSTPEFTDRFPGLIESADSIDTLGGATISSRAVKEAVNLAFLAFESVKEG